MRRLWLLLLCACAPTDSPATPKEPKYRDVAVYHVTANLPGVGVREWDGFDFDRLPQPEVLDGVLFYDATTGRKVEITDPRFIVLKEYVRQQRRLK